MDMAPTALIIPVGQVVVALPDLWLGQQAEAVMAFSCSFAQAGRLRWLQYSPDPLLGSVSVNGHGILLHPC